MVFLSVNEEKEATESRDTSSLIQNKKIRIFDLEYMINGWHSSPSMTMDSLMDKATNERWSWFLEVAKGWAIPKPS